MMLAISIALPIIATLLIVFPGLALIRRDLDGVQVLGRVLEIVAVVLLAGLLAVWGVLPPWVLWVPVAFGAVAACVGVLRWAGVLRATGRPAQRPRTDGRPRSPWPSRVNTAVVGVIVAIALGATVVAGA